jgi:hypothetical protein
VLTQTWPAPGVPLVTGAGLGDAFLPKIPLSGLFAVGLGTGVGVATLSAEAAGDGLFLARVFFGLPPGEAAVAGVALGDTVEAGDGLAFSVFFARRCFGLADGVGVCE